MSDESSTLVSHINTSWQMDDTLDMAKSVVTSVASLSLSDILKNILVLITLLVVWGFMLVACIYSR